VKHELRVSAMDVVNLGKEVLMPVLSGQMPDQELFALFVSKVRSYCRVPLTLSTMCPRL
jgi:hypothetical protein